MRTGFWHPAAVAVVALGVTLSAPLHTAPAPPAGAPTASVAPAAQQVTTVQRVSPLDRQGRLRARYVVGSTGHGFCWTTSFMNGRLYRCFKGNSILDPCWKERGRDSVVCLPIPWSSTVVRLRLTKRLPAVASYGPGIWGLRIGDRVQVDCLVSSGASGTVGKLPISYFCRRGWVLLGEGPDRTEPLWTMATAQAVGGHLEPRGRKPLTRAWKAVLPTGG